MWQRISPAIRVRGSGPARWVLRSPQRRRCFCYSMPIIKNVPICVVRNCQALPKNESIWCGLSFVVLVKEMRKLMFATRLASNQILLFP